MERPLSTALLHLAADPLNALGPGLTVRREGNLVRWGFAGQSAIVELLPDGKMSATFVDREGLDAVSNQPAAAAYTTHATYALGPASTSRMVVDMLDFFSGVREPRFTFFGTYSHLTARQA